MTKTSPRLAMAAISAAALLALTPARAAPTLQIENGQLIGALGVEVQGQLFDVRFVDGTFTDIFVDSSGLDATTAAHAEAFSLALANQVFGDDGAYDNDSGLTRGCNNNWRAWCFIYTPWLDNVGQQLSVGYFLNANRGARGGPYNQPVTDHVSFTATGRWVDTGSYSFDHGDYVYADWSASLGNPGGAVPEPSTLSLAALALLGAGTLRRRARRGA